MDPDSCLHYDIEKQLRCQRIRDPLASDDRLLEIAASVLGHNAPDMLMHSSSSMPAASDAELLHTFTRPHWHHARAMAIAEMVASKRQPSGLMAGLSPVCRSTLGDRLLSCLDQNRPIRLADRNDRSEVDRILARGYSTFGDANYPTSENPYASLKAYTLAAQPQDIDEQGLYQELLRAFSQRGDVPFDLRIEGSANGRKGFPQCNMATGNFLQSNERPFGNIEGQLNSLSAQERMMLLAELIQNQQLGPDLYDRRSMLEELVQP